MAIFSSSSSLQVVRVYIEISHFATSDTYGVRPLFSLSFILIRPLFLQLAPQPKSRNIVSLCSVGSRCDGMRSTRGETKNLHIQRE